MKITFEQTLDKYKRPIIQTTYDSIEYTQQDKEAFLWDIFKHLGATLLTPELARIKFETVVWLQERSKAQ